MIKGIRILSQVYDIETGAIEKESIHYQEHVQSPKSIMTLGYDHATQIEVLQAAIDFKLRAQEKLINDEETCPSCGKKNRKQGHFISSFHAIFTDHQVKIQRRNCNCGWRSPYTVEGLFGSSLHPELLERQSLLGAEQSYQKAQRLLGHECAKQRPINNDDRIKRTVTQVGEVLESIKISPEWSQTQRRSSNLIVQVDGGHLASKSVEKRSFEAMIATVYRPEALQVVDKNHRKITDKTSVASAKEDKQATMKKLLLNACWQQGLTADTVVESLTDGAKNCWNIIKVLDQYCHQHVKILDWFHIGKKFKECQFAIPQSQIEPYDKIKWHLWHGHVELSLIRLEQLKIILKDHEEALEKLKGIKIYIENNRDYIVNYHARKLKGKIYTSQVAETSVNSVINIRQKKSQKMQWTRTGAHAVLQIRTSIFSEKWEGDWTQAQQMIYKEAA